MRIFIFILCIFLSLSASFSEETDFSEKIIHKLLAPTNTTQQKKFITQTLREFDLKKDNFFNFQHQTDIYIIPYGIIYTIANTMALYLNLDYYSLLETKTSATSNPYHNLTPLGVVANTPKAIDFMCQSFCGYLSIRIKALKGLNVKKAKMYLAFAKFLIQNHPDKNSTLIAKALGLKHDVYKSLVVKIREGRSWDRSTNELGHQNLDFNAIQILGFMIRRHDSIPNDKQASVFEAYSKAIDQMLNNI